MKLSINLIKLLQERKQLGTFTQEYDSLYHRDPEGKAYANTIAGCMDIAYSLNEAQIPYCVIGGLAVAFHIHQIDHEAFLKWRGTQDIDLLVEKAAAEKILKGAGYEFRHLLKKMPGARNGVYEYAKDENGESLSLGLREAVHDQSDGNITRGLLQHSTSIDLYSIPVRVPMIRDLTAMKRYANRTKDRADIKLLRQHYQGIKV